MTPGADGHGPGHHCAWRRSLESGWAIYDVEVQEILSQGLPDTFKALQAILDDIDSRLGLLEYTLRAMGIPPPPGGIPDDEGDRYWGLYSLRTTTSQCAPHGMHPCGGAS